jgi:hypothetical protein
MGIGEGNGNNGNGTGYGNGNGDGGDGMQEVRWARGASWRMRGPRAGFLLQSRLEKVGKPQKKFIFGIGIRDP